MKSKSIGFVQAVNWEYVHAHHPRTKGKVSPTTHPAWIGRIIEQARKNGWKGRITLAGAARIINANLY